MILDYHLSNVERVNSVSVIVYLEVGVFLQEFSAITLFLEVVIAK